MGDNKNNNVINFYEPEGDYGCFCNYSDHAFTDNEGKYWRTSEHYFQAKKFEGTRKEEIIRSCEHPGKTSQLGRERDPNYPLRSDWEQVKEQIMADALYYKFSQNDDAKKVLLGTGDALIVEDTENDGYWGNAPNGTGPNRLGVLLVELRDRLRSSN